MEVEDALLCPALEVNSALLEAGGVSDPKTGEEFLANVILERRSCEEIVVAPLAFVDNKQNVFAEQPPAKATVPDSLLPTSEWQDYQVVDFSELRTRVCRVRSRRQIWNHSTKLPAKHVRLELWRQFFRDNDPTLSFMLANKQSDLELALEILDELLRETKHGDSVDDAQGRWLFATLATLKLPLRPEIHSILRDIARNVSIIRSKLPLDDEHILQKTTPLNLIICLIARYFMQTDLAD